jgi:hypothetical protein
MDATELDERIRRLEARLGLAEPAIWATPNMLPAPEPWDEGWPVPTALIVTAVADEDSLPPAA